MQMNKNNFLIESFLSNLEKETTHISAAVIQWGNLLDWCVLVIIKDNQDGFRESS